MKEMKKVLLVVVLTSFSLTQNLSAQDTDKKVTVGMGVSLFNFDLLDLYEGGYANYIFIPIDFGAKFRLEPSVNIFSFQGTNQIGFELGVFKKNLISQFQLLYGVRLGISNFASQGAVENVVSVAPAIAGEYFFVKQFSLGSEVQLKAGFGEGEDNNGIATNTMLIVRFYF